MNEHQIELRDAIRHQIEYHEKWKSLLDWNFVGRDVDFGEFSREYPDYNIADMIERLQGQLTRISNNESEENMLQSWAAFHYLMDNGTDWGW